MNRNFVTCALAYILGLHRPEMEPVYDFIMAQGLYIDTYDPKVKTDRYGNRSRPQ